MHLFGISVLLANSAILYANLASESSHEFSHDYYDYDQDQGDAPVCICIQVFYLTHAIYITYALLLCSVNYSIDIQSHFNIILGNVGWSWRVYKS